MSLFHTRPTRSRFAPTPPDAGRTHTEPSRALACADALADAAKAVSAAMRESTTAAYEHLEALDAALFDYRRARGDER